MGASGDRSQDLPWWPAERTAEATADREPLSRARIVQAALRLVDRDGLEALSMRRLGEELGAGTTSVYWHVRDKDQLLDLVLDAVLGEIRDEVEATDDWRLLLRRVADAFRTVLVRHRHVVPLLGERTTVGPGSLGGLELLFGQLIDAGFTSRDAVLASQAVISFASGWVVFECRQSTGAPTEGRRGAELDALFGQMTQALPEDRYPHLRRHGRLFGEIGWDEQFDYALERLLDGIGLERTRAGRA